MVFTLCLQPRRGSEPLRWNVKQEQDQKDIVNNLNFLSSAMSGMCVGTFSSDSVTLVFNYLQRPEEGSSSRSSLGISTSFITGTAGFTSRLPHLASHLEPLSRSPPSFSQPGPQRSRGQPGARPPQRLVNAREFEGVVLVPTRNSFLNSKCDKILLAFVIWWTLKK